MAVHIDPTGTQVHVPGSDGSPLPTGGPDPGLVRLTSPGGAEATLYPGVGFNLIDWRVPTASGPVQVMHAEPDVLAGGSGTRSGAPILFPFPNRIAGATYDWDGRTYHLQPAHPGDPNAIHGFCAKAAWTDIEATGETAVTGRFRLSRDAAPVADSWPGDLELAVTFDLSDHALRITAVVTNVDDHPVPFGLGYHPYFTPLAATDLADAVIGVDAGSYWELSDSIPDGTVAAVTGHRDLQIPVPVADRVLDDVLTGLPPFAPDPDGLMERASLRGGDVRLALRCDGAYRDIVVFTPENREAIAIEPYTCPTDAVHLQALGHDVGWLVLAPGATWTAVVEFAVTGTWCGGS